MTLRTPLDILGEPLHPFVDRTPVDTGEIDPARYAAGDATPEIRRRRARFDGNVQDFIKQARRKLSELSALYRQVGDQINSADGMKAAIRNEAALGVAVFSAADVEDLRTELALVADTLKELEARVRADLVI